MCKCLGPLMVTHSKHPLLVIMQFQQIMQSRNILCDSITLSTDDLHLVVQYFHSMVSHWKCFLGLCCVKI